MSTALFSRSELSFAPASPMMKNHLSLVSGEVHLWFAYPDQVNKKSLIDEYVAMLSVDEQDSYHRLQQPEHKQEYLVSHALLRTALSQYADNAPSDWQFLYNNFGKPSVLTTGQASLLRFNLAHTNGLAVCAISKTEVGVDVEYHSKSQALLDMADHYFSTAEVKELGCLPIDEQEAYFFRYWTLKEAYIKAKGEGLQIPSSDFGFQFSKTGKIIFIPPTEEQIDAEDWSFNSLLLAENYTAAIAVNSRENSLQIFRAIPGHSYEKQIQ
jgi:4'-phosphopantetheinyl transferase